MGVLVEGESNAGGMTFERRVASSNNNKKGGGGEVFDLCVFWPLYIAFVPRSAFISLAIHLISLAILREAGLVP